MVEVGDTVSSINQKIFSSISFSGTAKIIGWVAFAVLLIGGCAYAWYAWREKKLWNKIVIIKTIVNDRFVKAGNDVAKVIKLGKGGFEILYLKGAKTWKIAHISSKVDPNTYEFYIMPDGYWYTAYISANMKQITKEGGLISVITTNPSMRSQYTSLEKQIDSLHLDKKGFWETNKVWMIPLTYTLVIGVTAWLIFKDFPSLFNSMAQLTDKVTILVQNVCLAPPQYINNTSLTPVG